MAAPSNIRINPFIGDGGTTNYVDFTEVHIIPAVSPFVVRLNEVPQKKDPSNMKVVYVDETTGALTTTVLTEVAATRERANSGRTILLMPMVMKIGTPA